MITYDIVRELDALREQATRAQVQVSGRLRGWSKDPQVQPPSVPRPLRYLNLLPRVSDVARYARDPQGAVRDRVCGARPTLDMVLGQAVHRVFHDAVGFALASLGRRVSYSQYLQQVVGSARQRALDAINRAVRDAQARGWQWQQGRDRDPHQYADVLSSLYAQVAAEAFLHMRDHSTDKPWLSEVEVRTAELGLARSGRADVVMGKIVAEIKLGSALDPSHMVQVAGYALALENRDSTMEHDYGVVILVDLDRGPDPSIVVRSFHIDDNLREQFLKSRDEMIAALKGLLDEHRITDGRSLQGFRQSFCSSQGAGAQAAVQGP